MRDVSTRARKRRRGLIRLILGAASAGALVGCVSDPTPRMLTEGWQQLSANQPDRALVTAQNILTESPRSPRAAEAHYLKGRALEARPTASELDQRRNLTAALEAYTEAQKRRPDRELAGRIASGLGNVCYWMDDYANAWRHWAGAYDLTQDQPTRAYILYRIGICQQRLGRFDQADRTFAAVVSDYGGTEASMRARQKMGARTFSLQVATFASSQSAQNTVDALRQQGFAATGQPNARGQIVVTVSPFNNYEQARTAREQLAAMFPDALVLP